ncbi:hypothetical protein [Rhizobium leguminosarum]|uniref:hypothetical protein n=1 Tax=Rhizobium leguminosarum TaxID=384 RepID=UPI00067EE575|nr:hypothetical protein [Rhizobium leguminosarum]
MLVSLRATPTSIRPSTDRKSGTQQCLLRSAAATPSCSNPKYEAQIAALERKVGQLAMQLDLDKKAAPIGSCNEKLSLVTGPRPGPLREVKMIDLKDRQLLTEPH